MASRDDKGCEASEMKMLGLQFVCTCMGIFSAAVMLESAAYVSDAFCLAGIVTGVVVINSKRSKQAWLVGLAALPMIAVNIVVPVVNHDLIAALGW